MRQILLLASVGLLLVTVVPSEQQRRAESMHALAPRRSSLNKRADEPIGPPPPNKDDMQDNNIPDDQTKRNESDTRIVIGEPYKTMIQTATRLALAQSRVTNHINIDTAMNLIGEAAHFLSKPKVLLKTLKVAMVIFVTMLATIFVFPSAHKFAGLAWHDPASALNLDRHLSNGLEARSVIEVIGSKTDQTLNRVGLESNSCRQKSICYFGEIVKCSFPTTAETLTKFASENFSGSSIKENIYARAFISGFVDRNCTAVDASGPQEAHNCLGDFFNSILGGLETNNQVRK